jgi:uncharacterized damage-inducible protein DinB
MRVAEIQLLFEYNDWANNKLLTKAAQLIAEQFTAPAHYALGSLRKVLLHLMEAEWAWRVLLQSGEFVPDLVETDFATVASMVERWEPERALFRQYVAGLTDADLDGIVRYNVGERVRERVRWHCLTHVVNHGSQHRAEAAAILTGYDQSPGDLDFSVYMLERQQRG